MHRLNVLLLLLVSILANASPDVKVVEVATLKETHEVGGLEFASDGSQLIVMAGAYDRTAHVWNWREGRVVATLPNADASNSASVSGRVSPDGRFFVHCKYVVTVWDARTWQVHRTLDGQVDGAPKGADWPGLCQSVEFSPDGEKLVVLRSRLQQRGGPNVSAYDTGSWEKLWSLDTAVFYPKNLAFGPNGKQVAIGGMVTNVKSWPGRAKLPTFGEPAFSDTGLIAILDLDKQGFVHTIAIPETNYASKQTVAWQGQRNTLTYSGDQALRSFNACSGALLEVNATESPYSQPGAYLSPNGRVQVETGFGPKGQLIRGVELANGVRKVLHEIRGQTRAVAWSRDSKYFALGAAAFSIAGAHPLFELMAPSKGKVIVFEVR
jgi:WD40 repeat protein